MARAEEVWKFFEENLSKMAVPEEEVTSITSSVCEETKEDLEKYQTHHLTNSPSNAPDRASELSYKSTPGPTSPSQNSSNADSVVRQESEMEGSKVAGRGSGSIDLASPSSSAGRGEEQNSSLTVNYQHSLQHDVNLKTNFNIESMQCQCALKRVIGATRLELGVLQGLNTKLSSGHNSSFLKTAKEMVSSLDKKLEKVDLAQIRMEQVMGLAGAEVTLAESLVTQLHTDISQASRLVWELSARTPEGQNMTVAIPSVSLNTEPAHFPQVKA